MELVYQPYTEWHASPDGVITDKLHLGYNDQGATPIILTYDGIVYDGDEESTHTDIMANLDLDADDVMCEGRVWYSEHIVTFWPFDDYLPSVIYPSSKIMAEITSQLQGIFPNFGNYQLIKSESYGNSSVILFTTVNEYIYHGFTGQEDMEDLYRMWEIQEKKKGLNKPEDSTSTGIAKKDFWRHYEMVGENIKLNENDIEYIITEATKKIIEADRHRPGYYSEYNKKRKTQGKSADRHKPGYYSKYNAEHPERLERGFTKGYIDGKVSNGPEVKQNGNIWYDGLGRPHSNDPYHPTLSDLLDAKEREWHDDDWEESSWDD